MNKTFLNTKSLRVTFSLLGSQHLKILEVHLVTLRMYQDLQLGSIDVEMIFFGKTP